LQRQWILELPSFPPRVRFRSSMRSAGGKPRDGKDRGSEWRTNSITNHTLALHFHPLVCPLQDTKDVSSGPPFRMGQIRPSNNQPHKTLAILFPSQSPSYTNQFFSRQSLASLSSQ
jgi:hypothetical protein